VATGPDDDAPLAEAEEVARSLHPLCSRLTEGRLAVEVDYLWARPAFERPYGWAWAAMLVAAAYRSQRPESSGWSSALEPLAGVVAQHTVDRLPRQACPVLPGLGRGGAPAAARGARDARRRRRPVRAPGRPGAVPVRAGALAGPPRRRPAAGVLRASAKKQVEAVCPLTTEADLMATHWLVSFALLATGRPG
jgi:hypothetical protein